ncbi:hypothetical protein [Deinococcus aquatilis]|uniref:hypothetical protein n=1 Tax=Deinococcus aquatilis TaxID=519440 RepID=UPI0003724763|nr:hypothetical protein [Deinococcus aquatilis]
MAASKASVAARVGSIANRNVAAYTPPTAPANITHAAIAKAEVKTLSPVHPLGTVKEA